ncbi:uncharacterized protein DMENIID0001_018960 [Sergentomyia squamirostris]
MAAKIVLVCFISVALGFSAAVPAIQESSRRMENSVEQMRSSCDDDSDTLSCLKFKVMNFLDSIFQKDRFQIMGDVEVQRNGVGDDFTGRSSASLMDKVEQIIHQHDVTFKLPGSEAKLTISGRDLNSNDLSLKLNLGESTPRSAGEARRSKIKKLMAPIVVLIVLKAMTIIPMALGILGIKAWNALQLSFFSFVISTALAIFQLCKKIQTDGFVHPQIAAHGPWDHRRSFETAEGSGDAQNLAYSAYF